MLLAKSTLMGEVVHNVFVPFFFCYAQTCVTLKGHSKLLLTKYWNEEFHQVQVVIESSKV